MFMMIIILWYLKIYLKSYGDIDNSEIHIS